MCGIAGAKGNDAENSVRKMLEAIRHRGPDGSWIFIEGDTAIGNVLLKITGNDKQPISNGDALTFNGEIYNFRKIADELNLDTDSDTRTLYELIRAKGIERAISELDGDFAFAYFNNGEISIARDITGVKPLFYSIDNGFAFASEKKALASAGAGRIIPLMPGHLLTFKKDGISEKKAAGLFRGKTLTDENQLKSLLIKTIKRSLKKRYHEPCAVAFSGGLDSSIIAALCKDALLYCAGMIGSHDIDHAKKAAKLLGLENNLHIHEITEAELKSATNAVIKAIESSDLLQVSIALPLYFASKDAHNDGIRVMLSGQGADELFAGYKRYENMNYPELQIAIEKDLGNIAQNNLERDDAVTMANSVELRVPYLDREVVELALRIAPELKIRSSTRKYILRSAAKELIPIELAFKEKKAAQYSSGIYSALKKLSKKNFFNVTAV